MHNIRSCIVHFSLLFFNECVSHDFFFWNSQSQGNGNGVVAYQPKPPLRNGNVRNGNGATPRGGVLDGSSRTYVAYGAPMPTSAGLDAAGGTLRMHLPSARPSVVRGVEGKLSKESLLYLRVRPPLRNRSLLESPSGI